MGGTNKLSFFDVINKKTNQKIHKLQDERL